MNTFSLTLNDDETELFLQVMQALGCSTPDALFRVALWNQCQVSGIPVPVEAFSLRVAGRKESRRRRVARVAGVSPDNGQETRTQKAARIPPQESQTPEGATNPGPKVSAQSRARAGDA